jgi:hypothetical protein
MKSNENLQKDVQSAIRWEPLLSETEIGVIAKDGVITLTGVVDSYANIHSVKLFAHQDAEVNYAKEAIEKSRQTFQTEMRIVTKMDVARLRTTFLVHGEIERQEKLKAALQQHGFRDIQIPARGDTATL